MQTWTFILPQAPYLQNGANNSIYFIWFLWHRLLEFKKITMKWISVSCIRFLGVTFAYILEFCILTFINKNLTETITGNLNFKKCIQTIFKDFFWIFEFYFIIFLYSRSLLVIHFIHISVYMPIPITQFITPPPPPSSAFPPWCLYVCSLQPCLNFCPAHWFICTIFLGTTYMR